MAIPDTKEVMVTERRVRKTCDNDDLNIAVDIYRLTKDVDCHNTYY